MTIFHIIWTILLLSAFVAIAFWAFSSRRTQDFEEASRLPLENEAFVTPDDDELTGDARND